MNTFFKPTSPIKQSPLWRLMSYLLLALWALIVLFPLYWLVITAFKSPSAVANGPKYIPFVDYLPTLDAWNDLLYSPTAVDTVARPFYNTFAASTTSAILALVIGTSAAYALLRFQYRLKVGIIVAFVGSILLGIGLTVLGVDWAISLAVAVSIFVLTTQTIGRRWKRSIGNNDISFWLISQRMLPPIAVVIPIYILFQQINLLDTVVALIISYTAVNLPLVVWFMRDFLETIPIELEESAFIDGATRTQALTHIVLPLAMPGLVATYLITLIFTWNEYTLALFLSEANAQTLPLIVVAQNATRGPQWWNISILVLVMIAPIVLVALILERYIAKGLLIGAIKS